MIGYCHTGALIIRIGFPLRVAFKGSIRATKRAILRI